MKFTKMHGCGNDYVYVDLMRERVDDESLAAIKLSDRHFGIGGDGVIYIQKGKNADFEMVMYNADGSRGAMCGNGIRCVAKYCYDNGLTDKTSFTIESMGAVKYIDVNVENGEVVSARVDMGAPSLDKNDIPVNVDSQKAIREKITVADRDFEMTCVSMGNPHAVVFLPEIDSLDLEKIGPSFEHHPLFPDRVNTEFVRVIDAHTLQMRVWERGSGETFACGTGTCATVVAAVLNGYCKKEEEILVHLRGGDLRIIYHEDDTVTMIGPATYVFEGKMEYPKL